MPPSDERPFRPTRPGIPQSENSALWRTVGYNQEVSERRFDAIDGNIKTMSANVDSIRTDVKGILETDERRAKSTEKRNQRLWQVGSTVLAALCVAAIIALFKVFAPIALSGLQNRAPTVNETVDHIHQITGEH